MEKIRLTNEYVLLECNTCGVSFALASGFVQSLRDSGSRFYCPTVLGHSMYFPKTVEKIPQPHIETVIKTVTKTEGFVGHNHSFSRAKKPVCKICGLYQHMLKTP